MVNDEQLTWPGKCGYRKNPEGITIYATQTLILPFKIGYSLASAEHEDVQTEMIQNPKTSFNRQRRSAMLAALGASLVPFGNVIASANTYPELSLSLYNLHTTESYKGVFWAAGDYDPGALKQINNLFRDHRTNDVIDIDRRLLSILYLVDNKIGSPRQAFSVISGYRSPETNRKLALNNAGVAKNSYHMKGRAVDIRLPGTDTRKLREAGLSLRVGGVGYYKKSNFIHLDTGPYRVW